MSGSGRLAELTWPEAAQLVPPEDGALLVIPLGACEQHGAHLPLGTDTMIASALSLRLAGRRHDVCVGPALPYGASGEHAGFTGTISMGLDALRSVIIELIRSADAFSGVVLLSAHGGNATAIADAISLLHREGRRVMGWAPSASAAAAASGHPSDAHAGFVETSVLLAIDPDLVRADRAAIGDMRPLPEILPDLRAGGMAAVAPSGVLGDPSEASAEAGALILDAWVDDLVAAVDRWRRSPGRVGG